MTYKLSGAPVAYVYVTDRARALDFYLKTLGLTVRDSDDYGDYLAMDGALLRLTVIAAHKAHEHPVVGWEVADIVEAAKGLKDRGVSFIIYEGMGQDALGIWSSDDGKSKMAFFADPDGNALMLTQAET
jgi:predicted enzyme related to lactoylglutathione lyase